MSNLVTLLTSAEFFRNMMLDRRLAVLEGVLHDPAPPQPSFGGGYLRRVYGGGLTTPEALAIEALRGRKLQVQALVVIGDPPGTWRGSLFTPTRAVIQSRPGDPPDLHADLLPGVKRVTIDDDGDPDRLLSSIVRHSAASGRTDRQWWTRSGDASATARA